VFRKTFLLMQSHESVRRQLIPDGLGSRRRRSLPISLHVRGITRANELATRRLCQQIRLEKRVEVHRSG